MAPIDDLKTLAGTAVAVAFEGDDFTAYRVTGPGIDTQVRDDDEEAIASLVASHEERVTQQDETSTETLLRWHEDPENEFALPEEDAEEVRERARMERRAAGRR